MTHRRNTTAAALTTILAASAASAQPAAVARYDVIHNFRFMPQGDVVEVTGAEFRHAWIRSFSILGNVWSAQASNQHPDFDPFGTDAFTNAPPGASFPIAYNSGIIPGVPVPCVYNTFNIPPTGFSDFFCIILTNGPSFATPCTEFDVQPYSTTAPFDIRGTVTSSGGVNAVNSECYAYSAASVAARGGIQMANGTITWGTTVVETIDGQAGAIAAATDPVYFTATNLNDGTVIEAPLLDFDIEATSTGEYRWEAGLFETDVPDMTFVIDIPPTYVAPGEAGRLELVIDSGVVVASNANGIFAGLPPAPGTTVPISFPLPNDFNLNYDLNLDPTQPWDVLADLSGGGGIRALLKCPADLDGSGSIDFGDVSVFLALFAEGSPLIDFTGEGDIDFADVSLFLEFFAKGCLGPKGPPKKE